MILTLDPELEDTLNEHARRPGVSSEVTTPGRKTRLRWVWIAGLVLALIVCTPLLWQAYWRVPGKVDLFLHRMEYENIVRTIKAQKIVSEERGKTQHINNYKVWGRRSEAGQYTITIQTADWGHLGTGGYIYADTPPTQITNQPHRNIDAPGDLPFIDRRLDHHWWTAYNNLY
jgi:hypothetical protein